MEHTSHEEYVALQRSRVAALARDILTGNVDVLEAAHEIAHLRWEIEAPDNDAALDLFVGIESETDALPIGEERQHWSSEALARLEPDLQRARAWAQEISKAA